VTPGVTHIANREQGEPATPLQRLCVQYPSGEEVWKRVDIALKQFGTIDQDLIHVNVNERSITHRLAEHLQNVFPCWHVDCEYNRKGDDIKRWRDEYQQWEVRHECLQPYDTEAKTVYPDIIVHRRRTSHNLLVIEAKKRCQRDSTPIDEHKLKCFTSRCGHFQYRYGLLLILGDTADEAPCQRWFIDGEERCIGYIRKL